MAEVMAGTMPATVGKGKNITLWVIQVLLAAMFLMAGASKLAGAAPMVQMFGTLGLGQWFRYFTGALEVLAAIFLLIPGRAIIGAALLVAVMIGAVLTHLLVVHTSPAMPLVLLVLALIVVWGRQRQIAAFQRGR